MRIIDLSKYRVIKQPLKVDLVIGDEVGIKPVLADNSTIVNIPASLTEVSLIAQNSLRREVTIHNNSNGILYVIAGSGVTSTNYSWKLRRGDHLMVDTYRGQLSGIFTNATGFAMVTEKFY